VAQSTGHDVVVVGAGVIGLACAWRCAQRGMRVLVLEREADIGAGASGVAAGMLAPVTEAGFGEEPLLRLNLASAALWPSFAAELAERSGLDPGFRESGALAVAADRDDAEELRRLFAFQRELGLDVRWLAGRECRRLEPRLSPRVPGGILSAQDHQVEPRLVVRALRTAFEASGGELRFGVEASADEIDAPHVVLAAGCWSGAPVRPVKGQILRLRGEQIAERLVRTPHCYVVSRASGETVVGATMEERGFDTAVTGEGVFTILEAARRVLPDIGELEFVEAAARLRPGTPDNAPLIGPREDGVIWATGHHRNGVLLAPITAAAVAAMVSGEAPPEAVEPFGPERFAPKAAAV
jgi:glycine oxidase